MDIILKAVKRNEFGKNETRRLRRTGQIPAVLYGGDVKKGEPAATPLTVDPKAMLGILNSESGANTLIGLKVAEGSTNRVLVKEYQVDPIRQELLHVDFYRVAMDKKITVAVPVVIKGESKGVKQEGGLMEFVHREVEIECLPAQIPEHFEVDVTELMLGQRVRVKDLISAESQWTPVSDPDTMIVQVVVPKAEVEEEPEAEAIAEPESVAEPELIKKGKSETAEEEKKE